MIYELGYLVLSTLPEEQVAPEVSKLKEILAKFSAKVIADEYPVLIDLAYTMITRVDNKNAQFDTGYFGWIKFEADAEVMAELKKELDRNTVLLRYMLTRTVKENTIASKKPLSANIVTRSSKAPRAVVEKVGEMDKKEVDTEIDKLIEDVPEKATNEEVAPEAVVEAAPEAVEAEKEVAEDTAPEAVEAEVSEETTKDEE
jgi:ribosomal protein S6